MADPTSSPVVCLSARVDTLSRFKGVGVKSAIADDFQTSGQLHYFQRQAICKRTAGKLLQRLRQGDEGQLFTVLKQALPVPRNASPPMERSAGGRRRNFKFLQEQNANAPIRRILSGIFNSFKLWKDTNVLPPIARRPSGRMISAVFYVRLGPRCMANVPSNSVTADLPIATGTTITEESLFAGSPL